MDEAPASVFNASGSRYDRPGKIVTLGTYYPQTQAGSARKLLREVRAGYGEHDPDLRRMREGVEWTATVNALNRRRRWALRRCAALLEPTLADGIAIAVVPSHAAHVIDTPMRELALALAASENRFDATECLERHAEIRRILFGGPSTRALHRQTVHVVSPERIRGRRVLLLDDIAKGGASLMACRELLMEAGAACVQPLALARVVVPDP